MHSVCAHIKFSWGKPSGCLSLDLYIAYIFIRKYILVGEFYIHICIYIYIARDILSTAFLNELILRVILMCSIICKTLRYQISYNILKRVWGRQSWDSCIIVALKCNQLTLCTVSCYPYVAIHMYACMYVCVYNYVCTYCWCKASKTINYNNSS